MATIHLLPIDSYTLSAIEAKICDHETVINLNQHMIELNFDDRVMCDKANAQINRLKDCILQLELLFASMIEIRVHF